MRAPPLLPANAERIARDLHKWRTIFVAIAVVVPALLFALFERQARRLDVLGARGVVTEATVTAVSRQGGIVYVDYAYEVDGKTYTWNVDRSDAPYTEGETFPVVVSPDDPTLSRPGTDLARGTIEAAKNRRFSKTVVGAFSAFFVLLAAACHFRLRRVLTTGRSESDDPAAYRQRLIFTGVLFVPLIVAMFVLGIDDARAKGESIWPGIIGLAFGVAVILGSGLWVLRDGPSKANERSARVLRWVVPLSFGIALLRLVLWMTERG